MNLRVLRYFQVVAEELHFGRASRRLHITQPPLSLAIKKLENELGTLLFRRTRRKVELTDAGQTLLEEAHTIFVKVAEAERRVRRVGRGDEGRLLVGYISMAIDTPLPRVLRRFHEHHPGIELSLTQMRTVLQLDAIRSGHLPVGFARPFEHDLEGIDSKVFHSEPYVLVIPSGHPLEGTNCVKLKQLEGEQLILFSRGDQELLYRRFMEIFEAAGIKPEIAQEAPTTMAAIALAAAGFGISFVPRSSAGGHHQDVSFLPLDCGLPPVEISMLWRTGSQSEIFSKFRDTVEEYRATLDLST